ncbi:MAG: methionine--tRNA ligase [Candidatus Dadabacteria bacterium]|nr:MAG: methionine--tRNA ligase [Candidatus Dadabacteria bacterium]
MNPYKPNKKVLITAALPYANGLLHVGHIAGAYLPSDIFARFLKLNSVDVKFICGSDDYGVAILLTAEKENKSPKEVAAYYNKLQQKAFEGLNIKFDIYGSTSQNPYHKKTAQHFFLTLYKKGFFEKKKTRQFYDEKSNMFLPDRYVKGTCGYCGAQNQNSDQCEQCGKVLDVDTLKNPVSVTTNTPAAIKETVHWFLDLSRFSSDVRNWLNSAVVRENTKKYVSGLLESGLVKRAMTRDLSWGVPVPLDDPDAKNKVLYVWFDAPIGYVSNTIQLFAEKEGNENLYTNWWKSKECDIFHFIGEDNTIFHTVVWIAMLKAEGTFSLPKGVIVNNFLNIQFPGEEEEKISKSRGKAIWINDYLENGGNPDSLRYYLTSIAPENARTVYKPDDLIQKHNSELADTLGNLVSRTVSFCHKYFEGKVPKTTAEKLNQVDKEFLDEKEKAFNEITLLYQKFSFRDALKRTMDFARYCNKYIDTKAPWATRKTDLEITGNTLSLALNGIKLIAVCLLPVIPASAEKILDTLGISSKEIRWSDAEKDLVKDTKLKPSTLLFEKM